MKQFSCSNCKLLLPTGCFSKKKCRQRNPKNLLCLACLGRCSSSSMMLTYSNSNSNSNKKSAKKKPIKRECFECGKFLPRDRFSKTQWTKNKTPSSSSSSSSSNGSGNADCKSCVEKKIQQQATDKSICQHCRRPKASPGFHICRECHLLEKEKEKEQKPLLAGGVRYSALDVRDDNFQGQGLSFETPPPPHNPLDWTTTLIGTYQLIYLSIDENWSPEPVLSSTVQGTIQIELTEEATVTTTTTEEDDQQQKCGIKGSIHLKHLPFQERLRAIDTFHSIAISGGGDGQQQGRQQGRRQQQVQHQNQASFYASHVHHFAPETTWHDPLGDVYTLHGASNCGGKLKVLASDVALFLEKPQQQHQHQRQQQSRRRRNNANNRTTPTSSSTTSILMEHAHDRYTDVTMYWCCRHLRLPEDVGRVIREYVCPPPVLPLLAGDIVLVASMMGEDEVNWSEVTLVGRKI